MISWVNLPLDPLACRWDPRKASLRARVSASPSLFLADASFSTSLFWISFSGQSDFLARQDSQNDFDDVSF